MLAANTAKRPTLWILLNRLQTKRPPKVSQATEQAKRVVSLFTKPKKKVPICFWINVSIPRYLKTCYLQMESFKKLENGMKHFLGSKTHFQKHFFEWPPAETPIIPVVLVITQHAVQNHLQLLGLGVHCQSTFPHMNPRQSR